MTFKFGAFKSSSAGGGGGGLYAGISRDGKKPGEEGSSTAGHSTTTSAAETGAGSGSGSGGAEDKEPEDKKDAEKIKGAGWSSSLRFAPVIRKPPNKSTARPLASFPASTATSKAPLPFANSAEDDDDEPLVPPPHKALHIPGRAKAALTAAPKGPAVKGDEYSVFARQRGYLAAHAPNDTRLRSPRLQNPESGPGQGSKSGTRVKGKVSVDAGIPGLQHSMPALLAKTSTLSGFGGWWVGCRWEADEEEVGPAPPLTLPDEEVKAAGGDDVNGFAQTEAGKKLRAQAQSSKNKKKKGKGKGREIDPAIYFAEDYDPARPNDYGEWQAFVKKRRQDRREAARREREERQRQSSDSQSYTSDSDKSSDDEPARKPKGKFFAPPPEYNESSRRSKSPLSAGPAPPSRVGETGDEAYARRLALSQGRPAPTPVFANAEPDRSGPAADDGVGAGMSGSAEEAFLRRAAIASRAAAVAAAREAETGMSPAVGLGDFNTANASIGPPMPPPGFVSSRVMEPIPPGFVPAVGNIAHIPPSFVAASTSSGPPPPPANFVLATASSAPQGFVASAAPLAPPPTAESALPEETMEEDGVPYMEETNAGPIAPSSAATMLADAQARARAIAEKLGKMKALDAEVPDDADADTAVPAPMAGPSSMSEEERARVVAEAQAQARAIAARFAGMAGVSASEAAAQIEEAANKAPGQRDFARRLMDRYGWKEGQGLGADSSGRTSILTVEANPSAQSTKRKKGKNEDEPLPKRMGMAAGIGKGRGTVVDSSKEEREREEKERFGEPTRVVCLCNVVAVDELDDDLATEIAEEARKHGIVERCFARVTQRPCEESEAVRVFILFSGLVGAWKAVKAFDGRFFGGREVKAKFYLENAFTLGDFDL